ncbi:hypothetical protein JP75_20400 [Devosia riboflavina]|uniref:Uncharacterized protein n=1 Tax=Devosia riboflavina TaxID=46914 RepID=A0A087LY31_9HYPH|nr:hypothetical protein [Devosia riboflavina]KFL29534.1 hypothetical protein JP75_20400 [Devosia riboflavina]
MIGRLFGTSVALCVTAVAVAGIGLIVAMDLAGEDLIFGRLAAIFGEREPQAAVVAPNLEEVPALAGAKDITFFKETPVAGLPFKVTTGVRFASPADLAGNLVGSRWCYIAALAGDGVERKITLAHQQGSNNPVFHGLEGLPSQQLDLFRLGATALAALARSHCNFDFTLPGAEE